MDRQESIRNEGIVSRHHGEDDARYRYCPYHLRDLVVDVAGRGIPVLPDPVHARLRNSAALVADAYSDIIGALADRNLLGRRNTPTQGGLAAKHG